MDASPHAVFAEQLAPQLKRLPVKLLGFRVLALVLQQRSQIDHVSAHVRVLRAEQFAAQLKRFARQGFSGLVIAKFLQHHGQVVHTGGGGRMLSAIKFAVYRQRFLIIFGRFRKFALLAHQPSQAM